MSHWGACLNYLKQHNVTSVHVWCQSFSFSVSLEAKDTFWESFWKLDRVVLVSFGSGNLKNHCWLLRKAQYVWEWHTYVKQMVPKTFCVYWFWINALLPVGRTILPCMNFILLLYENMVVVTPVYPSDDEFQSLKDIRIFTDIKNPRTCFVLFSEGFPGAFWAGFFQLFLGVVGRLLGSMEVKLPGPESVNMEDPPVLTFGRGIF